MASEDVRYQALPPEEAIAYFKAKGYNLAESWDWRDVWQKEHATMFTVAKTAGFDVLKDIHAAVDDTIGQGLTLKQFQARLTPILQAKGWWGRQELPDPLTGEVKAVQLGSPRRLQIIYDTNMRMAQAAGEWARIQRTKATSPFLRYTAILDGRTRPLHRAWEGTILPVDHPWWATHYPPNGWRCRCSTIQLSQHDLNAMGWEVSPDPVDEQTVYTNERTGEVTTVPMGIDPGFGYNPGQAALDGNAARALMGKLVDASPDMAAAQAASAKFVVPAMKRDLVDWISPRLDALEAKEPIKTTGQNAATWECDGRFLVDRSTYDLGPLGPMTGLNIWTWDDSDRCFRIWWFDGLGESAQGTARFDASSQTWRIRTRGSNGRCSVLSRGTIRHVDNDHLEWTWRQWDGWGIFRISEMHGSSVRQSAEPASSGDASNTQ